MKKLLIVLMAVLLIGSLAFAHGGKKHKSSHFWGSNCVMDNISMEFEDGTLILEHRDNGEPTVEITEEFELYINGKHIETNDKQKKLLGEFYENMDELTIRAAEMGIEGAKIGAKGAKLGVDAIASLFKLLDENYDTEDYEREMEKKAKALEKQADKLEEQADDLEKIADNLEDIYDDLENEIDELGELDWY
ncbi:MAG: hypothetical protein ABIJ45_13545 [Candidatus Zixiibacteriota bacterium]